MRSTGTARFDIGCEITEERDALEIVWLFKENRFTIREIKELERLFAATLTAVCRSPDSRVAALMS